MRTSNLIKDHIGRKLKSDPLVHDFPITVEVRGKKVVLGGKVDSYSRKYLAEDLAFSVHGVDGLENLIHVVPTAEGRRLDHAVWESISGAMAWPMYSPDHYFEPEQKEKQEV